MKKRLQEKLIEFIHRHQLFFGVDRLGIAVSGGADSVALLYLLLPLCRNQDIETVVLHANHGLRQASVEEAEFVRGLAKQLKVPFVYSELHVDRDLSTPGKSVEMLARKKRMNFFRQAVQEHHLDAIATGHHLNDAAETLFLRLARGAGLSGLSALRPVSELPGMRIIRPLLCLGGAELQSYLRSINQPWREDQSNHDLTIARNRLRYDIFPYMEKTWAPTLQRKTAQTLSLLYEEDLYLEASAKKIFRKCSFKEAPDILFLLPLFYELRAIRLRVIRMWLFELGVEEIGYQKLMGLVDAIAEHKKMVLQIDPSLSLHLSDNHLELVHSYKDSSSVIPPPVRVQIPGETVWGRWHISVSEMTGWEAMNHGAGESPAVACLSQKACKGKQFWIRSRMPGDRISPTGLKGSRKLKDFLIDKKVPQGMRDELPILATGHDVVYLPGARIHRNYAVPTQQTPSWKFIFTEIRRNNGHGKEE